jgi:Cu/Ag efflux pump CusA
MEYHPQVSSAYADAQTGLQRMLAVLIAVAIGVLLLLQSAFGSWRLAAGSMVVLATCLVGGVVAALVGGGELTVGSMVGFLAVLGIAARNQLGLAARLRLLERNGMAFGPTLVLRGARERLGPILMTALATGLVFLPILLIGDGPGLEVLQPMAVVVVGGVVTATLISLFIVPTLHLGLRMTPGLDEVEVSIPQAAEPQPAGGM